MKHLNYILLLMIVLFYSCDDDKNRTIKIMPVGNSITAGEHYGFPDIEERTGYRKALYELLIKEKFSVDFVGSTSHGKKENDNNWYDWNSESYPGWKIESIADTVLKTLPVYKPDILLMHVGTNGRNWEEKPLQLEQFLDGINNFSIQNKHNITVFLALILDFFEGNPEVSYYNEAVKDMIANRRNDSIKIILVDMEKGAGFDYSDNDPDPSSEYTGGDMWGRKFPGVEYDFAHPNEKGNKKMAKKWFEELKPFLKEYKR